MIRTLLIMCFALSCNSAATTSKGQNQLSFEVLLSGDMGGKNSESIEIIRDQQEMDSVMSTIYKNNDPSTNLSAIDFEKNIVIAFFMGERSTGGYGLKVLDIEQLNEKVVVHYKETQPAPTDMVTMVITQPYLVIKMDRTTKQISFFKKDM